MTKEHVDAEDVNGGSIYRNCRPMFATLAAQWGKSGNEIRHRLAVQLPPPPSLPLFSAMMSSLHVVNGETSQVLVYLFTFSIAFCQGRRVSNLTCLPTGFVCTLVVFCVDSYLSYVCARVSTVGGSQLNRGGRS